MKDMQSMIHNLKELSKKYELSVEQITEIEEQQKDKKVCVPVIGPFSSGKSSLLNTLLGDDELLRTDITPETAIPTELEYAESAEQECIFICYNSGELKQYTFKEFGDIESGLTAKQVKYIRFSLCCQSLSKIPDLRLVDMPGFESGLEAHNQAIDGYADKSMAYLITFAADNGMVLSNSLGNILKELCQREMPLVVVITKCDKADNPDDFKAKEDYLKQSLKKYIGDKEIKWCRTSSHEGDIDLLIEKLNELQEDAEQLWLNRSCEQLRPAAFNIRDHLQLRLNRETLSGSKWRAKSEELRQKIEEQKKKQEKESSDFLLKLPTCISSIQSKVTQALNNVEPSVAASIMSQQADAANELLNTVTRSALLDGIQEYYEPLVEKYIKTSATSIGNAYNANASVGGFNVNESGFAASILTGFSTALLGSHISGIAGSLLTSFGLGGIVAPAAAAILPPVGLLLGLAGGIKAFTNSNKKRREEAENKLHAQLHDEVFPNIVNHVGTHLETELTRHAENIVQEIQKQSSAKISALEKALDENNKEGSKAEAEKERLKKSLQADLEQIGGIINELSK